MIAVPDIVLSYNIRYHGNICDVILGRWYLSGTGCQAQRCSCCRMICKKRKEKATIALCSSMVGVFLRLLRRIRWIQLPTSSRNHCHGPTVRP